VRRQIGAQIFKRSTSREYCKYRSVGNVRKELRLRIRLMWGSAAARSAASSLPNTIQKLSNNTKASPHHNPSTTQYGFQNRKDACATTRKVNLHLNITQDAIANPTQDRRRPILRSPPTTPRNRIPLHQSLRLGIRNLHPTLWRAVSPPSRSRRLRRRPMHIPPRRIQQGGSEGRCREQRTTPRSPTRLSQGRTYEEEVCRRDGSMEQSIRRLSRR
jgi:hypothetical protein